MSGSASATKPKRAPNPNAGHRDRLRERFARAGADGVQDYELLELVLFNAIPIVDVKPLAKRLIKGAGSFADVVAAPPLKLAALIEEAPILEEAESWEVAKVKKTTRNIVHQLSLIRAASLEAAKANVMRRPVLSSWSDLLSYARASLAYDATEQFRVLFLNTKNALIADEKMAEGTVDHVPVYVREVIKRALTLDAKSLILMHNHPSGDPTPSRADIEVTKGLVTAAGAVSIGVHDHLVIGRGREVSFKSLGLM